MKSVAFGQRPVLQALCLRASSCTVQKPSTVLFQNSAFMVAKTSPFGLKNPMWQYAAIVKVNNVFGRSDVFAFRCV